MTGPVVNGAIGGAVGKGVVTTGFFGTSFFGPDVLANGFFAACGALVPPGLLVVATFLGPAVVAAAGALLVAEATTVVVATFATVFGPDVAVVA